MKNINSFITELESLKVEMGKGENTLTPKDKHFILERKLREFKTKEEQLQEEIQREINDFFAYMNMKQASIETFSEMKGYVEAEIKKLEQAMKGLKVAE